MDFWVGNIRLISVGFGATYLPTSVTRLGDLLHFWQLFKACGNSYFAKIANILGNYCKGVHFSSGIILGNFYRNLATFYWSHCYIPMPCIIIFYFSWLKCLRVTEFRLMKQRKLFLWNQKTLFNFKICDRVVWGSGRGTVDSAAASYASGPGFESSHWANFIVNCL